MFLCPTTFDHFRVYFFFRFHLGAQKAIRTSYMLGMPYQSSFHNTRIERIDLQYVRHSEPRESK